MGIFGRGASEDQDQDQDVPAQILSALDRLTETVAQIAGRQDEMAEVVRRQGIRMDMGGIPGRAPDVTDDLRAEEAGVTPKINWAMTPGGRAAALVGAGMDGFAVGAQLQREMGGLYPLVMTHDGSSAGDRVAREVDAAAKAARDAVAHGTPLYGDGTEGL